MSPRLLRRPQARRDIVAVALHIAEESPDAARRFLAAVERTLAAVAACPGSARRAVTGIRSSRGCG